MNLYELDSPVENASRTQIVEHVDNKGVYFSSILLLFYFPFDFSEREKEKEKKKGGGGEDGQRDTCLPDPAGKDNDGFNLISRPHDGSNGTRLSHVFFFISHFMWDKNTNRIFTVKIEIKIDLDET